jgi:hypothetical protein
MATRLLSIAALAAKVAVHVVLHEPPLALAMAIVFIGAPCPANQFGKLTPCKPRG